MARVSSLLVPLSGLETDLPALTAAASIAERFEAHVTALFLRVDALDAIPLIGEGMAGGAVQQIIEATEAEWGRREEAARATVGRVLADFGIREAVKPSRATGASLGLEVVESRGAGSIARIARVHDLTLFSQSQGTANDTSVMLSLEAALFDSGRPVMVVPDGDAPPARSVAIAWKDDVQGARALSAALPFIAGADTVTAITVLEDERLAGAARRLADSLAWRGIPVDAVEPEPRPDRSTGEILTETARRAGADTMVMGAYSHSRLRQLLLGGVTRHILNAGGLPVLMAH